MSMFRKTVIATALIGAGLGSMAGAASANEGSAGPTFSGDSCDNGVVAQNENGSGRSLGDTVGGDQGVDTSNLCHIASDNEVLNDSNIAVGGVITEGDTLDIVDTVTDLAG